MTKPNSNQPTEPDHQDEGAGGLAARFGVASADSARGQDNTPSPDTESSNKTDTDPFELDRPVPPPPRRRSLIPVAFWLPESLIDRLGAYCERTRTTRREALLQAVEAAAEALPELISADARDRAAQAVPQDDVGGLFPRSSAAPRPGRPAPETSATITIRVRADHLSTMDRIAGNQDLSRSALARIALNNYLDNQ